MIIMWIKCTIKDLNTCSINTIYTVEHVYDAHPAATTRKMDRYNRPKGLLSFHCISYCCLFGSRYCEKLTCKYPCKTHRWHEIMTLLHWSLHASLRPSSVMLVILHRSCKQKGKPEAEIQIEFPCPCWRYREIYLNCWWGVCVCVYDICGHDPLGLHAVSKQLLSEPWPVTSPRWWRERHPTPIHMLMIKLNLDQDLIMTSVYITSCNPCQQG